MTSRFETWAKSNYARIEQGMNGARGTALHGARSEALNNVIARGLPTPQQEEWRYTNLELLEKGDFTQLAQAGVVDANVIERFTLGLENRAVFIDGFYSEELSSIAYQSGITIQSLGGYLHATSIDNDVNTTYGSIPSLHETSLAGLNKALVQDGLAIVVEKGISQETSLEIIHFSSQGTTARLTAPRILVIAKENARCSVVERFIGGENTQQFLCAVSEIKAHDGACVDYYAVTEHLEGTTHYHSLNVESGRSAQVSMHLFPLSGDLIRNEVNVHLIGSGSHTVLNGLSVPHGKQHIDNSTVIRHAEPHCESSELFKGVYRDQSRGVFQGTIIVEKPAQKTNAFQSNQAILLSKEASIDAKPQLKIWADDVKCTHGATVGQLDEEALFYIKSRGIDQETAQGLLVDAFAGEVLKSVKIESLKDYIRARLS
jgi:Fe-S cluster assembly protein SufD